MNRIIGQRALTGVFGTFVLGALLHVGPSSAAEQRWQLTMNNAELRDVVEEMSTILDTTVILDPKVQGRITVMSRQALNREGVRQLFYSVLDAHDFSVIDQGDQILIVPVAQAKSLAGTADPHSSPPQQFVTQVIALGASNEKDMMARFGVTAQQAARTGFEEYHPGVGMRDVTLRLGLTWQWQPQLALEGGIKTYALVSDARNSPLTGENVGAGAYLNALYRF